jgi:hypothetical protein
MRQLTSPGGKPSRLEYVRHRVPDNELRPFGVPNHIVPSAPSRIEEIEFDAKSSALVNVLKVPFLNLLRPPFKVPAHTVPSLL